MAGQWVVSGLGSVYIRVLLPAAGRHGGGPSGSSIGFVYVNSIYLVPPLVDVRVYIGISLGLIASTSQVSLILMYLLSI